MQARTPQKKKSLEVEIKLQQSNNSCVLNNSSVFPTNNGSTNDPSNELITNNSSIVSSSSGPTQKGTAQIRNNSIANPNSKVSLVRKYVQQELQSRNKYQNQYAKEKDKEKQYREVVISDEFIRSHKLYKMLKQQMAVADARHLRETTALKNELETQNNQVKNVRDSNHQLKVQLWQYKNQLMELKSMLNEEQEQNKKLVEQYEEACRDQEGEEDEGDEQDHEQQKQEGQEKCNIQLQEADRQQQANMALDEGRIQGHLTDLSHSMSECYQITGSNSHSFGPIKDLLQKMGIDNEQHGLRPMNQTMKLEHSAFSSNNQKEEEDNENNKKQ